MRTVLASGLLVTALGMAVLSVLPRPLPYPGVAVSLFLVGLGSAALGIGSA